jgi:hypothetical protein
MIDTERRPTLIRLHLVEEDGGWTGTVEIPGVGSVPLTETQVDGSRVEFVLPVEGGLRFEAQRDAGALSGQLWQGDESVRFRLQREPDLPPPADREPRPGGPSPRSTSSRAGQSRRWPRLPSHCSAPRSRTGWRRPTTGSST